MSDNYYGDFFDDKKRPDDIIDREFDELIIKDAKKTHSRIFGALALYSFLAYVLMTALSYGLYFISESVYVFVFGTSLGINLANAVIMYLICLPVFYLMVRKSEVRKVYREKIGVKEFIGILAVSQVLMTVGNYIGIFFNRVIGFIIGKPITNTTVEMIESSPLWVMLVFSVILAPIAEEFLMRKLLIDRLSKFGSGFALIVSSVAFGLFHGNFYQFFYATLLGFVLGYLYIRGGIHYSIALHMIINFMGSVLATLYNRAANQILTAADPMDVPLLATLTVLLYTVLIYGLLIYGGILIFTTVKRKRYNTRRFKDARFTIPKDSIGRAVFANVGMIFFLIISAFSMLDSILA